MPKRLILILISLSIWQSTFSQGERGVQPWIDLTVFNEYDKHWEFYGDGGYRRAIGLDFPWNRFYIRPAVKFSPWKWLGLRAGVALFFTHNSNQIASNTLELRPWQGISIGWPKFRHIRFSHYFRLEQRYLYQTERDWISSYDLRFRYQLSTRIQPQPDKKTKYLYFPAFYELFADKVDKGKGLAEIYNNEARIGLGIGYTFNMRWSGQFMFIFQQSTNEFSQLETSDYLLRFSFRYELVPRKDMKRVED